MANSADLEQLTGQVVQPGTVASVNLPGATCTVDLGDLVTGELPWLAPRAGAVKVWSPPSVGEQCLVLCAEGDLGNGVALIGIWSDANPAPSDNPDLVLVEFPDGTAMSYDHAAHALAVTLSAGSATFTAPNGFTFNGDVTVNGDVVANGISLTSHTHGGVQAGSAQSGGPA